jgi:hypothetical protein
MTNTRPAAYKKTNFMTAKIFGLRPESKCEPDTMVGAGLTLQTQNETDEPMTKQNERTVSYTKDLSKGPAPVVVVSPASSAAPGDPGRPPGRQSHLD